MSQSPPFSSAAFGPTMWVLMMMFWPVFPEPSSQPPDRLGRRACGDVRGGHAWRWPGRPRPVDDRAGPGLKLGSGLGPDPGDIAPGPDDTHCVAVWLCRSYQGGQRPLRIGGERWFAAPCRDRGPSGS